ncbi:MAG: S28 family serine protease, partial [Bdellovibrionota bacterium]
MKQTFSTIASVVFTGVVTVLAFGAPAFASLPVTAPKATEVQCIAKGISIEEKLSCVRGLTFKEITGPTTPRGARQFDMQFTQLVDHTDPKAGTFNQRLILLHRAEKEPMVLQTSGYAIFSVAEASLTSTFGANQIQVEHRFFATSKPAVLDWSKLDIKQSADDFHAVTVAFKQIYPAAWVNTGASKGGMTSVYHHRFYPDDLAGTVADVAPLSFSTADERFADFVFNVGGDRLKQCRENMRKIQVTLLENRDKFVPNIKGN